MSVRHFAYVGVGLLVYASVSSAGDTDGRLTDAARREDRSVVHDHDPLPVLLARGASGQFAGGSTGLLDV